MYYIHLLWWPRSVKEENIRYMNFLISCYIHNQFTEEIILFFCLIFVLFCFRGLVWMSYLYKEWQSRIFGHAYTAVCKKSILWFGQKKMICGKSIIDLFQHYLLQRKESITHIYKIQNNRWSNIWNIMQFKVIFMKSMNNPIIV